MRGFLDVHAEFGGHHFVAAAAGVQLRAQGAELLDERGFDEMVNIFGFRIVKPGGLGFSATLKLVERSNDLLAFYVRENSGGGDGASPGAVEREFLREKAAVEMPGALEFVEGSAKRLMKPSASFGLYPAIVKLARLVR